MTDGRVDRGTGSTKTERYLTKLVERTFLRLWSYPNLFIDKKENGKGDGKEFCDLLVVFGDDLIIFSDKNVGWTDTDDADVAWCRWFRKAIAKSSDQIRGAERWLKEFPNRIFLDARCEKPFPIALPSQDKRRVHGIIVAGGAREACKKYFFGGTGTLLVSPPIKDRTHHNKDAAEFRPFSIGDISTNGGFIHVFDEVALDFVMSELDTAPDFIRYLRKREAFVRSGQLLAAPGEEDLLGYYLQSEDARLEHDFVDPDGNPLSEGTVAVIEQGEFEKLLRRPEYQRKKEADRVSFLWDRLIEVFTDHVLSGTSVTVSGGTVRVADAEQGVRLMAAETRVNRRLLSEALISAFEQSEKAKVDRFSRTVIPDHENYPNEVAYVFFILAYPKDIKLEGGYEQYRKVRANFLHAYCLGTLERNRSLKWVVGIGLDASARIDGHHGGSEDLLAMRAPQSWTQSEVEEAKELCKKLEIMSPGNQRVSGVSTFEYPVSDHIETGPLTRQQRRARERELRKRKGRIGDS